MSLRDSVRIVLKPVDLKLGVCIVDMVYKRRQFGALYRNLAVKYLDRQFRHALERAVRVVRDGHISAEIAERIVAGHLSSVGCGDRYHRLKHVRMSSDNDVRAPVCHLLRQILLARNGTVMILLAPVREHDDHVGELLRLLDLLLDQALLKELYEI